MTNITDSLFANVSEPASKFQHGQRGSINITDGDRIPTLAGLQM